MHKRLSASSPSERTSFHPQVEELNARIAPAGLTNLSAGAFAGFVNPSFLVQTTTELAGHGQGTYTASAIQSGAGPQYQLMGDADLQGFGHFAVDGSVHGVGFILHGHAGGTLTFTNDDGSITVQLQGPEQNAFAPLPHLFSEKIIGGTGAFQHLAGQENVQLDLRSIHDPDPLVIHGTFSLIEDVSHVVPPLQGHGTGTYTHLVSVPDVGQRFDLSGSANLADLGHVTVTGSVYSTGFIAQGHAGGTLTFQNSHGSVTVELTGPLQPGFAALPTTFQYQVVSSTGDYAGLTESGSLTLTLGSSSTLFGSGPFSISI